MSDGFNANPTIRNASDLPSRRRQTSAHQPSSNASLGLLTSTIPPSAYIPDPFSPSPPSSDEESSDEDADLVEPIDEQEIYGAHSLTSSTDLSRLAYMPANDQAVQTSSPPSSIPSIR